MQVWVNGCFDILHTGHLDLLEYAKCIGDCHNTLIVGIDTDRRVKELKGDKRPLNAQEDRKRFLKALEIVDDVYVFDTDDELRKLVKHNDIDFMVVGDQYRNKEVIGHENSKYGVLYYTVDDRSTTNIIDKIKQL